jgi:hypothetical protein
MGSLPSYQYARQPMFLHRERMVADAAAKVFAKGAPPSAEASDPAFLTYGNSACWDVCGPGTNNWDVSLRENAKLNENVNLQFRAEFPNAFNHASCSGINTSIASGNAFGIVTGARDGRLIQFGLKIQF